MSDEAVSDPKPQTPAEGTEEPPPPGPAPAPAPTPPTRRGLLGIEIALSNSSPTAGSEFTLYVRVTNPLDVPIWLSKLQVFVPSEVELVTRRTGPRQQQSQGARIQPIQALFNGAAKGEIAPGDNFGGRPRNWFQKQVLKFCGMSDNAPEHILQKLARAALKVEEEVQALEEERASLEKRIKEVFAGKSFSERQQLSTADTAIRDKLDRQSAIALNLIPLQARQQYLTDQMVVLTGSPAVVTDGDVTLRRFRASGRLYVRAKGRVLLDSPDPEGVVALDCSLQPDDPLQPGETAIYSLAFRTVGALFFRPIEYTLQYSLNFAFEPERTGMHTNAASQAMMIRAPITSVMWGSAIGGYFGYLSHHLQKLSSPGGGQPGWMDFFTGAAITTILSVMAVVFLARKSDAQSMVSVEDFWGGLVIGFLIGYTGNEAFSKFVPNTGAATP